MAGELRAPGPMVLSHFDVPPSGDFRLKRLMHTGFKEPLYKFYNVQLYNYYKV